MRPFELSDLERANSEQAARPAERGDDPCAGYDPIADYAMIGDARTAALVSRKGSVDWLCLPSFDDDAVFAAILDPEAGGRFTVSPAEPFQSERRYSAGSAVLETTFRMEHGRATLRDMLVLPCEDERCFEPQRELLRVLACSRASRAA